MCNLIYYRNKSSHFWPRLECFHFCIFLIFLKVRFYALRTKSANQSAIASDLKLVWDGKMDAWDVCA